MLNVIGCESQHAVEPHTTPKHHANPQAQRNRLLTKPVDLSDNLKLCEKFRDKNDFLSELRCSYISQGLYFEMISAYLKFFDLNNFFIINFESEVVQNLDQTLLKLSKFLKLDLSNLDYEIHSNKSGKPKYKLLQNIITNNNLFRKILKILVPQKHRQIIRNKIKNFNKEDFVYLQLSEEKRRQLFEKYFRKDIMKLENLIGKKMNWH